MITEILLTVIALLLAKQHVPVQQITDAFRRKPVNVVEDPILFVHQDGTLVLNLCTPNGVLEHKVLSTTIPEAPDTYDYAGKKFYRVVQQANGEWEYRR